MVEDKEGFRYPQVDMDSCIDCHLCEKVCPVINAKADVAKIESLKSAKGTFTQAGQFQVIIGNTVNDFYNDFIAVSGIDGVSKDAVKSAAKQNQNTLQRIMSVLAEIFGYDDVEPLCGKLWAL